MNTGKAPTMIRELEYLSHEERLNGLGLYSFGKRMLKGQLISVAGTGAGILGSPPGSWHWELAAGLGLSLTSPRGALGSHQDGVISGWGNHLTGYKTVVSFACCFRPSFGP